MAQKGSSKRREPLVVLEVLERRAQRGCSQMDRRTFRKRALGRLKEEFGSALEVVWEEPPPDKCTLPVLFLNGRVIHSGGYLPWEVLRPAVAWALALEIGVDQLAKEGSRALREAGIEAADWQDGLLEWLRRREED